jgi:hypothetical protein
MATDQYVDTIRDSFLPDYVKHICLKLNPDDEKEFRSFVISAFANQHLAEITREEIEALAFKQLCERLAEVFLPSKSPELYRQ